LAELARVKAPLAKWRPLCSPAATVYGERPHTKSAAAWPLGVKRRAEEQRSLPVEQLGAFGGAKLGTLLRRACCEWACGCLLALGKVINIVRALLVCGL